MLSIPDPRSLASRYAASYSTQRTMLLKKVRLPWGFLASRRLHRVSSMK